jgi:ABC-type oligopeptide transport system ATPase subunit
MSDRPFLVQTRDLGISFGGVRAVQGVDFFLAEGELRCVIGPNGAGKSTFFKLLTGQYQPTQGEVMVRGKPIAGLQTAVYPSPTPGGWSLIGRCPLRLFDPLRSPPALMGEGDILRFEPIDKRMFDRLWARR